MISDNIKELRKQKGLTQKELADLLHVTSQAVSRWEMGNVEPSVDTIVNMAKIFEVTTDEIIGGPENKPKPEIITEVKEKIIVEQAKPVLAICSSCKNPIYNKENIIINKSRNGSNFICVDCDKKDKEQKLRKATEYGISQRKKSFFWGAIGAILALVAGIIYLTNVQANGLDIAIVVVLPIFTYTFVSCMFLKNIFIEEMFLTIASWGIVKFPGIIWPFSVEGFLWLIGIKILFKVIGFLLGLAMVALALFVSLPISAFAYPYALKKSFKNPELTEMF